jgi:hypothetical protein
VPGYGVDADEDVFPYFGGGWRGIILVFFALSFSLLAFGGLYVVSAVVTKGSDQTAVC